MSGGKRTVLVCGSREGNFAADVEDRISWLKPGTVVVTGGARGVDTWASRAAKENDLPEIIITPDWQTLGKRAGYVRNLQMLDLNPDLVIAFWDGKSKGTLHTITEARKRGIDVEVNGPAAKGETK